MFDTLLLIEKGEAFYEPSLRKLHEKLVEKGINVTFEDFKRVYFEVRDKLYEESTKSLEEPHFNTRISQTLKRFNYNYEASDAVIVEATKAFTDEFMRYLCLDKNAPSVLEKLCEDYKLGIVSNFAIPEFVWTLLEKYDLKKFFNAIVISGDVNRRKPSPDIFYKALERLNVTPYETVFVGDTLSMDVKGAKAVGMKAILIKRDISSIDIPKSSVWKPPKDNVDPVPDKTIGSLSELLDIVEDC